MRTYAKCMHAVQFQPGTFQPRLHARHAALAAEAEGASDAQGSAGAPLGAQADEEAEFFRLV